jgi:hypothetical protein
MSTDILEFWSKINPGDRIHPADRDVFSRVEGHGFDLNCLPSSFAGPLRTARVVLLYLAPGFNPIDIEESNTSRGRQRYSRMRTGEQPLPGPEEHEPAWRWWHSRTRRFGSWRYLQDKVAVLNIGAYHSKSFTDWPLLAALPSSRVTLDWAQRELFPKAVRGGKLVICLRASQFWGLGKSAARFGDALFVPTATRHGHMRDNEMRSKIIDTAARFLAA